MSESGTKIRSRGTLEESVAPRSVHTAVQFPVSTRKPIARGICERVKLTLEELGHTVTQVSQRTAVGPYHGEPSWFIPKRFCEHIRHGQMPHTGQVVALSEITGISFYDWLMIFGYDLDDVARLQPKVHENRTIPLPTAIYNPSATVEWPMGLRQDIDLSRGEFISEMTTSTTQISLGELAQFSTDEYLYFKVGKYDTRLLPSVVPGSIVRIDPNDCDPRRSRTNGRSATRPMYLVSHLDGLTCTYVDRIDDRSITLVPRYGSFRPLICKLDDEALVLGRVDSEFRPLDAPAQDIENPGHDHAPSRLTPPDPYRQTFGRFLRSLRERIGLTYREARTLSEMVARELGDPAYSIALGALCDWETRDQTLMRLPHLITLAIVYATTPAELLSAARLRRSQNTEYPSPAPPSRPEGPPSSVEAILSRITLALRHAFAHASGLDRLSWDNLFVCGRDQKIFHAGAHRASLLVVDRHRRRTASGLQRALAGRPLFVIRNSTGGYWCSSCFTLENWLYLQPDPDLDIPVQRFRRADVEVAGQVTALLCDVTSPLARPLRSAPHR